MKTLEDQEAELYEDFVERYYETGAAEVPGSWPPGLRERCLFFLKVVEGGSGAVGSRSVLAALGAGGVRAALTLAGPEPLPAQELSSGPERYVLEREIGRGGMGRVLLAYDRDLRRRVAMKVLRDGAGSPLRASRFLEEAQATSQLEHPNIAPVYDVGIDPSGAPFFTMKWVRGRDLEEVLRSGAGDASAIRLVQILQQAAMGVDFAHSRGVVHRDLKPQNVMVGDYGEVHVVDWGLAKVLRRAEAAAERAEGPERGGTAGDAVATGRPAGLLTLNGTVLGSVAYMAPEQARGDVRSVDPRTDVFGLGAILYRILTGQAPYPESDIAAALARARRGDVTPPSVAAPDRSIPGELERICRKALAARPEDRYGSAREMHDALQAFVEGTHDAERREREAARLLEEASRLRDALGEAERRAAELKAGVEAERARLPDHAPEEAKGALWRFLSEAKAASDRSEHAFSSAAAAYRAVLRVDPDHRAARSALAGLHAARRTAAEERGDLDGARLHEGLARQHGAGSGLVELREEGLLRLESDPPGAEVLLSRYVERGLLLEAGEPVRLGATPLERPLPRGSYVATLRGPGLHEARYPFVIDRRPEHRAAVRLHPEGSIPPGFVQVPAGESILGGDTDLFSALPRERRVLPEIFAAGLPVTLGEYCAFLDERCAAQPPGSALGDLLPSFGKEEYAARGPDGRFAPAPRLDPRMPVMGIPLEAMDAYCGWIGRRLGRSVRLLDEREWERCARGADGRLYPWVNGFDWAFAKGGRSREGDPFLEPVGSFPRDVSSFGVRDMAGSIREACLGSDRDRDHDHDGYGPCRGGSWFNPYPFVFRADARTTYAPKRRATDIGFRVGYRLEEPS